MVDIREERPEDLPAIHDLNTRTLRQQEADLVDTLRADGAALLSLVASMNGLVVGHILYSPASVEIGGSTVTGAGLGPMAVLPEHQRQGIGSKLVEAGNRKLRDDGCPFIIVLGYPTYYPRFGFQPASIHDIRCQWNVPDNVFMLLVLDEPRMQGVSTWWYWGTTLAGTLSAHP